MWFDVPGLTKLRQANAEYKDILHILFFKFYINKDTSVLELFHVVVFQQKRFSVLTQAIVSKIVGLR